MDAQYPASQLAIAAAAGTALGFGVASVLYSSSPSKSKRYIGSDFDAIIVAAGGQKDGGPPPHVKLRLVKAAELYRLAPANNKPKIITTGGCVLCTDLHVQFSCFSDLSLPIR